MNWGVSIAAHFTGNRDAGASHAKRLENVAAQVVFLVIGVPAPAAGEGISAEELFVIKLIESVGSSGDAGMASKAKRNQ